MPDITLSEWTRRALGLPPSIKQTDLTAVVNVSNSQLRQLQAVQAEKPGTTLDDAFFWVCAQAKTGEPPRAIQ